jgi:predicted DNA-binding protein YlxM (UPF0122 family)
MKAISYYWTLVKLDAAGGSRTEEQSSTKAFFRQLFSQEIHSVEGRHDLIQRSLLNLSRNPPSQPHQYLQAELSLRCFISHQIEQVCIQLETQFGNYYGFTRYDLFPFVLDDDGNPWNGCYRPLGLQILQSFNPDRATLAAWTTRLVKQHQDIDQFLLERGLCMRSDWALLNGTSIPKLEGILAQFYQLTPSEVGQAAVLLESYHAVYRRDRLLKTQKGRCPPPTLQQLEEMANHIQQNTEESCSATAIQTRLHALADRLRHYRTSARGGTQAMLSLDQTENTSLLDNLKADLQDEPNEQQSEFLRTYRQQFLSCLKTALEKVVSDRLRRLSPPRDQSFLTALHLFYCKEYSMTEIAHQIEVQAQYQVTRLLCLKDFRADVRHWMLQCLHSYVLEQARSYVSLQQLDNLDNQIEAALSEQIDALIQKDQANAKTPKSYLSKSLFARSLCQHLKQQFANHQPPSNR